MFEEIVARVEEAVLNEDYTTLNIIARMFAKEGDDENAAWVRNLAHNAEDAGWSYDRFTDNALA